MVKNYTYDADLVLKASAAVASSAAGSIILDLGGETVGHAFAGLPEMRADLLIDVTALDIASNDESYDIIIQASPDADFGTAANIVELAGIHLGAKEIKRSSSDKDDTIGRYILPFRNERNGVVYRYIRIYTVVAGTTATITYEARLVKRD